MLGNKSTDVIEEFSNYLIGIKNLSSQYVSNIITTLKQFLSFMNIYKYKGKYESYEDMKLNDIRALTNSDIYSFIYYLAEKHYKQGSRILKIEHQGSRILKIEHLRNFFDFLFKIKHNIFTQPFKKINREKKMYDKLPNYLSLEESKRLLKLYSDSDKIAEIRDNAILHLLLNCGLRRSELTNLKIDDFNFEENKFIIFGKGNKERMGYLNQSTKDAILKYLKIRKNITVKNTKDSNILFISNKGGQLSKSALRNIIKKAYKKVNINSDIYTIHTLRHTCATLLYRNGIDIKIIKELLGHVQIDTTEIYTHLYDKDVMNALQTHSLSSFMMKDAIEFCAA